MRMASGFLHQPVSRTNSRPVMFQKNRPPEDFLRKAFICIKGDFFFPFLSIDFANDLGRMDHDPFHDVLKNFLLFGQRAAIKPLLKLPNDVSSTVLLLTVDQLFKERFLYFELASRCWINARAEMCLPAFCL